MKQEKNRRLGVDAQGSECVWIYRDRQTAVTTLTSCMMFRHEYLTSSSIFPLLGNGATSRRVGAGGSGGGSAVVCLVMREAIEASKKSTQHHGSAAEVEVSRRRCLLALTPRTSRDDRHTHSHSHQPATATDPCGSMSMPMPMSKSMLRPCYRRLQLRSRLVKS